MAWGLRPSRFGGARRHPQGLRIGQSSPECKKKGGRVCSGSESSCPPSERRSMYVSSTAPLPPNSMTAPSPAQVAQRRAAVNRINAASVIARAIVECPPDPLAYASLGQNIAADVNQAVQQVASEVMLAPSSSSPSVASVIPGNSVADPPVSGLAVSVQPLTVAHVRDAIRRAPKAIPLNYSAPQVSGCDIVIPLPSELPRPQMTPAVLMPSAAPALPSGPLVPSAPGPASAPQGPAWSPCPAGVPFQGRYINGTPVCGAMPTGGFVRGGPSFRRGYASIVQRGMHDAPVWGDAGRMERQKQQAAKPSGPGLGVWCFLGIGLLALVRKG